MGDPKFSRRKYEKPIFPWDADRIKEEQALVKKYGLKNKKEVWKAESLLRNFRRQSRNLRARLRYGEPQAEKEAKLLLEKLVRLGLLEEGSTIDEVLGLNVEAILRRRLQTLVYEKGLANTIKQARQFIVHGHTYIGERKVSIPSYMVKKDEEDLINYNPYSPIANESHPARPKKSVEKIEGLLQSIKDSENSLTEGISENYEKNSDGV